MKRLDATASVTFRVHFTPEDIAQLKTGAETHYDFVCRTLPALKDIERNGAEEWGVHLTWRDFDILSKICESPLVNEETSQSVWKIFRELRGLTAQAQKLVEEAQRG